MQKLAARINLRFETGTAYEGVAHKTDAADVNDRSFGNVENDPRVTWFVALDQFDRREQTTHFLITALNRVHSHPVGNRVQRRAFAQPREGLQLVRLKAFSAFIIDLLHAAGKLGNS